MTLLILWPGGRADVDLLPEGEVVPYAADLHDVADWVALAESMAAQPAAARGRERRVADYG